MLWHTAITKWVSRWQELGIAYPGHSPRVSTRRRDSRVPAPPAPASRPSASRNRTCGMPGLKPGA